MLLSVLVAKLRRPPVVGHGTSARRQPTAVRGTILVGLFRRAKPHSLGQRRQCPRGYVLLRGRPGPAYASLFLLGRVPRGASGKPTGFGRGGNGDWIRRFRGFGQSDRWSCWQDFQLKVRFVCFRRTSMTAEGKEEGQRQETHRERQRDCLWFCRKTSNNTTCNTCQIGII